MGQTQVHIRQMHPGGELVVDAIKVKVNGVESFNDLNKKSRSFGFIFKDDNKEIHTKIKEALDRGEIVLLRKPETTLQHSAS